MKKVDSSQGVTISNFNGGIGNDKYLSVPNGCYDGEGLDIWRGKRLILSTHNQNNIVTLPYGETTTYLGSNLYANSDGYLYDKNGTVLYKMYSNASRSDIRNITNFTISGTNYTLLFGPSYISRYSYNPTNNVSISRPSTTSDWTNSGSYMVHNVGTTTPFTASCTITASSYYKVRVIVEYYSAGSVSISLGGVSLGTISANGNYDYFCTASTTGALVFTPTADFYGFIKQTTSVDIGTVEEGRKQMTGVFGTIIPVLDDSGDLYIGNKNKVFSLDNVGTLEEKLIFSDDTTIVGITKIDDQKIIWTRTAQGGRVYYWDGVDDVPSRSIDWVNEKIMQVINQGNYHIVMTGGDFGIKKIRKSNGNSKQNMFEIREGSWLYTSGNTLVPPLPIYWGGNSENPYVNNVESFGDMVFLPGYNKILCYGKRIPGFPDAIFPGYALKQTKITAMYAYEGELRVAYENNKVITWKMDNYESMQDTSNYYYFGSRGYISFNPIVFLASQEKNGVSITLGYKTPTNTFLNIYYAIDRETDRYTFVIDENINPVTNDPIVGDVYYISTASRYVVTKVTKFLNYMFIETQNTVVSYTPRYSSTLTKVSGSGDSSIIFVDFHNYRHFDYVSETNSLPGRSRERNFIDNFFEIQFRVEFITRDGKFTPELNDFTFKYDNING